MGFFEGMSRLLVALAWLPNSFWAEVKLPTCGCGDDENEFDAIWDTVTPPLGPVHDDHLPNLAWAAAIGDPAVRFVRRVERHGQEDGENLTEYVSEQRRFGNLMLQAALQLAGDLTPATKATTYLVDVVGRYRQAVAEEFNESTKEFGMRGDGAFTSQTNISPNSRYSRAWPRAMIERQKRLLREGTPRAEAEEALFGGPEPGDSARARACRAVVSWVDYDWQACVDLRDQIAPSWNQKCSITLAGEEDFREHDGAAVAQSKNAGPVFGVYRANRSHCRVVLTRVVLGPAAPKPGAEASNEVPGGCANWYGVGSRHIGTAHMEGIIFHPSPLAKSIAERLGLHRHWVACCEARDALGSALAAPGERQGQAARRHALRAFARGAAGVFYYMVHIVPYSRGTISTAMMLHHALWLWAVAVQRPSGDGEAATASRRTRLLGECLPAWAEGIMPDALAWTFQREERFIDDGFWEALRSTPVERPWHTRAAVLRCISGLWDEEDDEWSWRDWKDAGSESNRTAERVPAEAERAPAPAEPVPSPLAAFQQKSSSEL